jgi:MoxR-like ATPase
MQALRLKDVPNVLVRNYLAKTNVFLSSKPGIGKTDTVELFIRKMQERTTGFKAWHFYGPSLSPTDIQMAMPDTETGLMRIFNNSQLPNAYTHPELQGVVFIGEMPNTDPTTLKQLQKYVNGEDMNGLRKPEGVMVIADGNRLVDKAGVLQQGRALMNRFLSIDVYTEAEDCIEYAVKHEWHSSVQSFLREYPHLIDNYDEVFQTTVSAREAAEVNRRNGGTDAQAEEGKAGIWASMRGWNRISNLEVAGESLHSEPTPSELMGSVGTGPGAQYIAHKAMLGKLASFADIVANPEKVDVPTKMDEAYALSTVVAVRCQAEQLAAIYKFAKRLPHDLQAYILRTMIMRKNFPLLGSVEYREWIRDPQLNQLITAR